MNGDEDSLSKKKVDKPSDNLTVTVDSIDNKKGDEEPKPRIVLTFRSEKSAKSSNMKIVSPEEKQEEAPRRSSRTRNKWEWICDSETSPKKDKSGAQTTSENDESDSSHTTPKRSTRRRSKDNESVLASAVARKEKSFETQQAAPQRLSRRIKPTAKVLENEELRMGLENQNNARLGLTDKSPEGGVRTRRSARPTPVDVDKEEKKTKLVEAEEVVEINTDDDSQEQSDEMKVKHLCELGLKAISTEEVDDGGEDEGDDNEVEELEEDDEIDDDPGVISKLLETDEETSDEEFQCPTSPVQVAKESRKRRPTRRCYSYFKSDMSGEVEEVGQQSPPRRSSKRATRQCYVEDSEWSYRVKRRRQRSSGGEEETHSDPEMEETIMPAAGGEEGSQAACPGDDSTVVATCFCDAPSNVYAAPEELTEPVFCQALETVDEVRVGCSHPARSERGGLAPLLRAGPRAPYFLACALHTAQLHKHMCCPACGLFCTQGTFYQCSSGHLFHLECGLPLNEAKSRAGCPHCGVHSYRWQPANTDCAKVKVTMNCTNKRIYLPDQREQCTPAYLSFSTCQPKTEEGPIIPQDLLPATDIDIKAVLQSKPLAKSPQQLCEAISRRESLDIILSKMVSSSSVNKPLQSQGGGTAVHCAARAGHCTALYVLQCGRANLDAVDASSRTPLMVAVIALVESSEDRKVTPRAEEEIKNEPQTLNDTADGDKPESEKVDSKSDVKEEDSNTPLEEDLYKVIRFLIAAGCDVDLPGPEGMTALHIAAQHGLTRAGALLLAHAHVDARDNGGWTPLVWAAENNHTGFVKLLLDAGADPLTTDNEGNSLAHWCALAAAALPLQLLLQRAPTAAAAHNAHGDTPLHIAARQGHYSCVIILLARGAKTDVQNSAGELPINVCSGQCQVAISLNMEMSAISASEPQYKLLSSDISNGREKYPVPCENEVDDAPLPEDFTYVTQHVVPEPIAIDNTISTTQGCSCKDGDCTSASCACAALCVRSWYVRGRLVPSFPYHDPPMLFECNQTCGCNLRVCGNSVVSRFALGGSLGVRARVFRRGAGAGWGLRAGGAVPRGAPVALYCGELLPLPSADARPNDQYMFALDVKQDLLEQCADKTQLCVDAAQYGSAARFINHSCAPNLAPVRVFTATRDLRLPTVALFAVTDIPPNEEFTFDYGDKFWSVKSKYMKCECGSPNCRYPTKSE